MLSKIFNNNFIKKNKNILIILITILPFLMSFFLEYALLLIPCVLCIFERWIHFFIAIFTIIAIKAKNEKFLSIPILLIISSFLLTFYHIGVEEHFFESSCQDLSINFLNEISKNCSIPKFFLNIRLTFWNIVYLCFEIFTFFLYYFLTIKKTSLLDK